MAERKPTKQTNGKNTFWIQLFVLLEVRGAIGLLLNIGRGKKGEDVIKYYYMHVLWVISQAN